MKSLSKHLRHLLIPGHHNNFRGKLLQQDALLIYLVIAFLMLVVSKSFSRIATDNILGKATDIQIEQLLEQTNEVRAQNGLSPLTYNEKLAEAAKAKAKHMFINNYWAHFSPKGDSPWQFIRRSGYQYEFAGENLAKNFLFSQNVIDAWEKSPTHRENLLRSDFSQVGFAVEDGVLEGEETTLVVQMFGSPLLGSADAQALKASDQDGKETVEISQEAASTLGQQTTGTVVFAPNRVLVLYIFIGVFIVSLALDLYIASRLKLLRLHGKTIAHLLFIITIALGVLLFLSQGAIL